MIEEELLAAVAASPNDDGPRLVYADWLQQQPDEVRRARGEYIAVACTTVRPRPVAKLQELLDRHGAAWLGPIAAITEPQRVWSRGFLDGCALATAKLPDAALEHPEWRVVRLLDALSGMAGDNVARVICQRAMKNLKGLRCDLGIVRRIVESAQTPRITELGVSVVRESVAGVVPLLAADCFTALRRLHLPCSAALLPLLLPVVSPELALIVQTRPRALQDWIAELAAARAKLSEVRLVRDELGLFERRSMEIVLHAADGAWNHLEVRWPPEDDARWRDELILVLRRLPAGSIQRISFVGPTAAEFDVARFKQRVTQLVPAAVVA